MKNKYLLIILLISSFFAQGQINTAEYNLKDGESIIYRDKEGNIISNKQEAEFYRIFKVDSYKKSIGKIKEYYKNGTLKMDIDGANYIDVNDNTKWKWHGKVIGYYENGEREREVQWLDGKQHGPIKTFYKSGKIRSTANYSNDKINGKATLYYENGNKSEEIDFEEGKKHGKSITYHENGEIDWEIDFVNGFKDGDLKKFFNSGKLNVIEHFENGRSNGEGKTYDASGALEQVWNTKNGVFDGYFKEYYKSGEIEKVLTYVDGLLVKEESFYESGNTRIVYNYIENETVRNSLKERKEYSKYNGNYKEYYENGNVKIDRNYLDGELDGEVIKYFKSGKIAEKNYYSKDDLKSKEAFDKFGNEILNYNGNGSYLCRPTKDDEYIEDLDKANYAEVIIFEGEFLKSKAISFKVVIEDGLFQYLLYKTHKYQKEGGAIVFDGPRFEYYDNAQIKSQVNFINDKKEGKEIFYDRYGNITDTFLWNNGVRDNWSLECDNNNNCEYVFESNFNDTESTELQGWSLFDNDDEWSFVTVDNDLMFKNKTDSGKLKSINLPISEQEDFQVTVLADWFQGVDNKWYGLIIGWKDWNNYIGINITANGYYKVEIKVKGLNVGMQDYEKLERVNTKGFTNLNIVRVQEMLLFSINGKILYSSEYSTLIGEEIGIFCSGKQTVIFDNFKAVKSNLSSIPNNNPYSEWAGNGSGVILTKGGYIATNNHVIKNANEIEVEFNYQNEIRSFKAEVVIRDEINDLAILRINDPLFGSLKSIPYNFKTRSSDVGESVFALGYPKALSIMGKDIKFTDGKISSKSGIMGDITSYQTTTPVQPGNSGGPLFDYKGNLIAINSSKLTSDEIDNVSYSIKSIYLLTLIDALPEKITLPSDTSISTMSLTNKIKVLSNYVVLIKVR